MKIFFSAISAVIMGVVAIGAQAEATQPVYVVDMQRVINDSIAGKAARSNMESEVKKREGSLVKMQNDLKAMKAELDKQGSLLSADALKSKQVAFQKKEQEFQKNFQENREELSKKNNEEIGKIVKEIDTIIKDLAKEKGYKMIVEKDQRFVIFVDNDYDVTDDVIKALDKKKMDS